MKTQKAIFISMIAATSLFANIQIPNETFLTSLQTRSSNSQIVADGSYKFEIINPLNTKCIQNTVVINKGNYNAKIFCSNGVEAKASGVIGKSIDVNYDFSIPEIKIANPDSGKDFYVGNVFKNSIKKMSDTNYNVLNLTNWSVFNVTVEGEFQSLGNVKIAYNASLISDGNKKDILVGSIGTQYGWNKNINIKLDNYQTIGIKNLFLKKNYNLELSANKEIKIENLTLGNGTGKIKAPVVKINSLSTKLNLGENNNTIIADTVYINNLKLGQLSKLTFKPYTNGKAVKVYINNLSTSSSSSIKLSTGEYHINNLNFASQSPTIPSFVNLDKNQKTQIFVNQSINMKNNPVINMVSVNDEISKETLPAANMVWFVNGNLRIGNGGTKINALMYAEKNVYIGSDASLRGAISAKNEIHITNNNSKIYYAGNNKFSNEKSDSIDENSLSDNNTLSYKMEKTPIQTKIAGKSYFVPLKINGFTGVAYVGLITGEDQCGANAKVLKDYIPVYFENGIGYYPLSENKVYKDVKLIIDIPSSDNEDYNNCLLEVINKFKHKCHQHHQNIKILIENKEVSSKNANEEVINLAKDSVDMAKSIEQCIVSSFKGFAHRHRFKINDMMGITKNSVGNMMNIAKNIEKNKNNPFKWKTDILTLIFGNNQENVFSNNKYFCSDNFAIRPAKFIITPINKNIKAGESFSFEIQAVDANGNIVDLNNYSIGEDTLNNVQLKYQDTNPKAITGTFNYNSANFNKGIVTINASYSEVGQLALHAQEELGNEFAKIDKNDTSADIRLIPSDTQVLNFVPYGFKIKYTNTTSNGENFTYVGATNLKSMNNLVLAIDAINKDGEITKNYTKDLYAKDGILSFSIKSTEHIDTSLLVNFNDTLLKASANHKKDWNVEINDVSKNIFDKGVANIDVGYGFEKDYQNPIPPFYVSVSNPSFKDINNINTIYINTDSLNNSIKNLYGKVELNNATTLTDNVDIIATYKYWDGNNWVINTNHQKANGEINLEKTQQANPNFEITRKQLPLNGKEIINVKAKNNIMLPYQGQIHIAIPNYEWYHPLANAYLDPSSSNKDCTTHPCVSVEFLGKSKTWGGINVNKNNPFKSNTIDVNSSKNSNTTNMYETTPINW